MFVIILICVLALLLANRWTSEVEQFQLRRNNACSNHVPAVRLHAQTHDRIPVAGGLL